MQRLVGPTAGRRSTRRSSSTRSWSRSATARSRNQPVYAAIGVDLDGHKDILGHVGRRRRRREREVLARGAHRAPQPRREGHVLRRLRRVEGPARQRGRSVPPGHDRADLHHPPDPQHLPLRVAEIPGADLPRHANRSTPRPTAAEAKRRYAEFVEKWGRALPGHQEALGQRLGGVHPVPGLPRRDPPGAVLDQRDREPERSLPPGGACPRPLPQRTVGDEDPLPGHPIPRPQQAPARHDGPHGGNQPSTPSPSPSPIACRPQPKKADHGNRRLTPFVGQSQIACVSQPLDQYTGHSTRSAA